MSGEAGPGEGSESDEARRALFEEVVGGLGSRPRRLPPKLFYDERGARLFEEITRLEEYYPTRVELSILERCLPEVADLVGPAARVVEFGTGSGEKTSMLLDALDRPAACVPIDIARTQLLEFAEALRRRHPGMEVLPLPADYTRPLDLPEPDRPFGRTLVFFPGSTIGNFEPADARGFLRRIASWASSDAALLVGVDLRKPPEVLEAAYDDSRGVTAEFNRNALHHLSRLFGAELDPEAFAHRAVWDPDASRIEMRLVCNTPQVFRMQLSDGPGEPVEIRMGDGEEIVTEHSYKYTPETFEALCADGGWTTRRRWTDERDWFAVAYLEPAAA